MPAAGATRRSIDWKPSFDRFIEWRQCGKRQCVVGCEHSCCSRSRRRRRRRIERERGGGGRVSGSFRWPSAGAAVDCPITGPKTKSGRPRLLWIDASDTRDTHCLSSLARVYLACSCRLLFGGRPTDRFYILQQATTNGPADQQQSRSHRRRQSRQRRTRTKRSTGGEGPLCVFIPRDGGPSGPRQRMDQDSGDLAAPSSMLVAAAVR